MVVGGGGGRLCIGCIFLGSFLTFPFALACVAAFFSFFPFVSFLFFVVVFFFLCKSKANVSEFLRSFFVQFGFLGYRIFSRIFLLSSIHLASILLWDKCWVGGCRAQYPEEGAGSSVWLYYATYKN